MRGWILITLVALVVMVTVDADMKRKKKKPQGCRFNGKLRSEGEIVYKNKSYCVRLRCIKTTTKKGKTKYLLKAKSSKGCKCSVLCATCTPEYDPVCGTDNKTYTNGCVLWSSVEPCGPVKAELLHNGECGKCPTGDCPEAISPVCGSDDNTYDNECALLKAACNASSDLSLSRKGSCEDAPVKPGSKCRYNGNKYEVWETIQTLTKHCMKITCQPSSDGKKPTVTFQDFNNLNFGCSCGGDPFG